MSELPPKQNLQFSILENEMLKLKYLREMSVEITSGFQNQGKLEQLKLENQTLQQQSERLADQLEQQLCEEYECSKNLPEQDDYKLKRQNQNATEELKHYSYLLGYTPSLDYDMEVVTLYYKDECFIKLTIDEPYELLQIHPKHPSFEAIKLNLHKTNDTPGLLATLRKFFDFVMNLKNRNAAHVGVRRMFISGGSLNLNKDFLI